MGNCLSKQNHKIDLLSDILKPRPILNEIDEKIRHEINNIKANIDALEEKVGIDINNIKAYIK